MGNPKIIIGFFCCEKNRSTKLQSSINTWLADPQVKELEKKGEIEILFFYGKETSRGRQLQNNEIELPVEEHYTMLARKTYQMINWVFHNRSFSHFLKIDDDVYIYDLPKLLETVAQYDFVGKFSASPMPEGTIHHFEYSEEKDKIPLALEWFPKRYAQGGLYALSRGAIRKITALDQKSIPELASKIGYEDIMVSRLLTEVILDVNIHDEIRIVPTLKRLGHEYGLEILSSSAEILSVGDLTSFEKQLLEEFKKFDKDTSLRMIYKRSRLSTIFEFNDKKREVVRRFPKLAEINNWEKTPIHQVANVIEQIKHQCVKEVILLSSLDYSMFERSFVLLQKEVNYDFWKYADTSDLPSSQKSKPLIEGRRLAIVSPEIVSAESSPKILEYLKSLEKGSIVNFTQYMNNQLSRGLSTELVRNGFLLKSFELGVLALEKTQ